MKMENTVVPPPIVKRWEKRLRKETAILKKRGRLYTTWEHQSHNF